LLGFETVKNYALHRNGQESPLLRLEMLEPPSHWFFVLPASLAMPDYQPDIADQDVRFLGLKEPADALLLNLVTLRPGRASVNLQGPIVINRHSLVGKQVIPKNAARFSPNHPLTLAINHPLPSCAAEAPQPAKSLDEVQPQAQRDTAPQAKWSDGIVAEVAFWDTWLRTKGYLWPDDFKRRMNPATPVSPELERILDQIPADPVRVLDVGAGPLTVFGYTHPRKRILLEAADALAREYDSLLQKYGIIPPVRTMRALAENLACHFATDVFDLVHANNSIDHCAAPVEAICQMLAVAKSGAPVLLRHEENEADNEGCSGFHQWNFTVEQGQFIIRGKGQAFNVTDLLKPVAVVDACLDRRRVTVQLRKFRAIPIQAPA
jgi:flagellar assembly factor FliW